MLAAAVSAGFVTKTTSPNDARRTELGTTAAGRSLLTAVRAWQQEEFAAGRHLAGPGRPPLRGIPQAPCVAVPCPHPTTETTDDHRPQPHNRARRRQAPRCPVPGRPPRHRSGPTREAARRLLAGESLRSVCRDLNDPRHPHHLRRTVAGTDAAGVLVSARISGHREYHGDIVADDAWPAIITPSATPGSVFTGRRQSRHREWCLLPQFHRKRSLSHRPSGTPADRKFRKCFTAPTWQIGALPAIACAPAGQKLSMPTAQPLPCHTLLDIAQPMTRRCGIPRGMHRIPYGVVRTTRSCTAREAQQHLTGKQVLTRTAVHQCKQERGRPGN
jgi:DNA-binding MarR family transcriptional regulator